MVIATRGGGLGPHRHDGTSPLPAYTTLAPAFSPNVSRNEKEGPETKIDSLEHFLRIDLTRIGEKIVTDTQPTTPPSVGMERQMSSL